MNDSFSGHFLFIVRGKKYFKNKRQSSHSKNLDMIHDSAQFSFPFFICWGPDGHMNLSASHHHMCKRPYWKCDDRTFSATSFPVPINASAMRSDPRLPILVLMLASLSDKVILSMIFKIKISLFNKIFFSFIKLLIQTEAILSRCFTVAYNILL